MNASEFFLNLDRRWIFLVIGLVVLLPIVRPFDLPGIKPTDQSKNYFDTMNAVPEGTKILISADFDPGSKPELYPMLEATLRHAFKKKLRIVVMTLWLTGIGMVEKAIKDNVAYAKDHFGVEPQEGKDYVFIGWKTGGSAVVIGMGVNILEMFSQDNYGKPLAEHPIMAGVKSLKDFKIVVSLSAGTPGFKEWVQYGVQKNNLTFVGGCTGIIIPEAYPYLQAGQMKGVLGGMKGAAEYEKLLNIPGTATGGMVALSLAQFMIILLVAACNIIYIASGRWRKP